MTTQNCQIFKWCLERPYKDKLGNKWGTITQFEGYMFVCVATRWCHSAVLPDNNGNKDIMSSLAHSVRWCRFYSYL